MWRKNFIMALAVLIIIGLQGCANQKKLTVITVWSYNINPQALAYINQTIIPGFSESFPGYAVSWENMDYEEFKNKLDKPRKNDRYPDIIIDSSNLLGLYVLEGKVVSLDVYIKSWTLWQDFLETPKKHAVYNNLTYGIPLRVNPYLPLANTEVLKQFDINPAITLDNWHQLLEFGRRMLLVRDSKMIIQSIAGLDDSSRRLTAFELLIQQNNGHIFSDVDLNPSFNSPQGIEALEFLIKLYNTSEVPGVEGVNPDDLVRKYRGGLVGMIPFASYDIIQSALESNDEEVIKHTILLNPFESSSKSGKNLAIIYDDLMMIAARSIHKSMSFEFIRYFLKPLNHLGFAQNNFSVPVQASLGQSDYVLHTPFLAELMQADQYGWELENAPEYPILQGILSREIDKAVAGEETAREALSNAQSIWMDTLSRF